ncbi:unnamed protein product [Allacma fusca]|uniref:CRAL-TRIO domain-containing protein n=1 Tax=Allacma fusca TaxID=39272 RepID=A0A8J2PS33_9HEXA|nr:unnamed protein product [Allacma fusca]
MSTTRFWFAVLSVFTFEIAQASPKGYLSGGIESNFIREEVRTWKSPDHLRKNYPYYLSGYDEEEKPIWVLELGKWDVQRIALNGNKTIPDFSNYVDKAIFNILQSLDLNSTEPTAVTKIEGIIDMDGFAYSQLASIPTVDLMVKTVSHLVPTMYKYVNHAYIINTNFYGMKILELLRPILGPIMERVEIYGTDRSKWLPKMLKTLPRNQLPEWYGGERNYVPVKVYG